MAQVSVNSIWQNTAVGRGASRRGKTILSSFFVLTHDNPDNDDYFVQGSSSISRKISYISDVNVLDLSLTRILKRFYESS